LSISYENLQKENENLKEQIQHLEKNKQENNDQKIVDQKEEKKINETKVIHNQFYNQQQRQYLKVIHELSYPAREKEKFQQLYQEKKDHLSEEEQKHHLSEQKQLDDQILHNRPTINQIRGLMTVNAFALLHPSAASQIPFLTSSSCRIIDAFEYDEQCAHEIKSGVFLKKYKKQIENDIKLLKADEFKKVSWHFFSIFPTDPVKTFDNLKVHLKEYVNDLRGRNFYFIFHSQCLSEENFPSTNQVTSYRFEKIKLSIKKQ